MLALVSSLLIFTACEEEPNSAPTCTISSPEDGAELTIGKTVTIRVVARDEDNNLEEVRFYINGIDIGSATSFPYRFDWDTSEEDPGSLTIKAEVIDEAQKQAFDEININLKSGIIDIDGNVYSTVQIGQQIWMAENLKTTTYNNGTSIDLVTDNASWENNTTGAYCWYDNNEFAYADTYGALYNWHALKSANLCPDGWHVPNYDDWVEVIDYLGGDSIAGGKMKTMGNDHWHTNVGASNESGFSGLPGGWRGMSGFYEMHHLARFWSASEYNGEETAWYRVLRDDTTGIFRYGHIITFPSPGFSVRCVKDKERSENGF